MGGVSAASAHPALAAAVEAARAAGEIAMRYYRGGVEVTIKPDRTPVTQADREVEQAITRILGRAFPDWGFLGEEFGERGSREIRWIIDPIDGTKNFVRRIPIWATLIALEDAGEVVAGVIHNPVTGDLYTARRGGGAHHNGEPIHVSKPVPPLRVWNSIRAVFFVVSLSAWSMIGLSYQTPPDPRWGLTVAPDTTSVGHLY